MTTESNNPGAEGIKSLSKRRLPSHHERPRPHRERPPPEAPFLEMLADVASEREPLPCDKDLKLLANTALAESLPPPVSQDTLASRWVEEARGSFTNVLVESACVQAICKDFADVIDEDSLSQLHARRDELKQEAEASYKEWESRLFFEPSVWELEACMTAEERKVESLWWSCGDEVMNRFGVFDDL